MSLATYSDLQTSMTSWLSRTGDTNLIALYPDFITLAEAKFNRGLRTRAMEASSTITPASGIVTLPTDFLELRRIYINTASPVELEYITPENFYLKFPIMQNSSISPSRYYTIESGTVILSDQTTSQDVKILYYQKIPALSVSNTSNWLLTAHPDLYLAESLAESYDVIQNEAMAQKWLNKAELIGQQIIESDKHGKYSGSVMRVIAA